MAKPATPIGRPFATTATPAPPLTSTGRPFGAKAAPRTTTSRATARRPVIRRGPPPRPGRGRRAGRRPGRAARRRASRSPARDGRQQRVHDPPLRAPGRRRGSASRLAPGGGPGWPAAAPRRGCARRPPRSRRTAPRTRRAARTRAARAGVSWSSTTISASPTASAISASASGSAGPRSSDTTGSGSDQSCSSSRRFAAGAQLVEAQPRDHRRQPAAQVVELAASVRLEPEPGLLDGVLGLGRASRASGRRPPRSRGRSASNRSASRPAGVTVTSSPQRAS